MQKKKRGGEVEDGFIIEWEDLEISRRTKKE
jgi:hypothetical protein